MHVDLICLTYTHVKKVMLDLKNIGANTPMKNKQRGLITPRKLQRVIDAYEFFRVDGVYPASFEVVYGHAWNVEKINKENVVGKAFSIPIKAI